MKHAANDPCWGVEPTQLATPALRRGVSLLEVLFGTAACCFLGLLCAPLLLNMRETSRRQTCQQRLSTLTLALRHYHDAQTSFPVAAYWDSNITDSLALHRSKRVDLITQANWAILLLPYLDIPELAKVLPLSGSIGDPQNARFRQTRLATMNCPSDHLNRTSNPYRFENAAAGTSIEFARGNYAINGGTHNFETDSPTTTSPHGDHVHLELVELSRQYALWGNGIAGINKSFQLADFVNGQSTLVALEEVRAGVQPLDPRGVWSLGQIGGSITWGHGVNGDDAGPNQPWVRGDDILNCRQLHASPGPQTLLRLNMPCVDYVDVNQQATARSQHAGGVLVSFVDGSVRWMAETVDPGLWHLLHSRETPARLLAGRLDSHVQWVEPPIEVPLTSERVPAQIETILRSPWKNSLEMSFVLIPPGSFTMGVPDESHPQHAALPAECPPHSVTLTHTCWMGVREVTRSQFAGVCGRSSLPEIPAIAEPDALTASQIDQLPVTGISWDQTQEFCRRLSQLPAEQNAGRKYRLPSEAEWEYACRTNDSEVAHTSHHRTQTKQSDPSGAAAGVLPPLPLLPVGSFPPNAWGIYDLRGNAWEWTNDWYARDYYLHSPAVNPLGPRTGDFKVVRGSDWRFIGEVCHIDANVLPPWKGNPVVGFRVLCEFAD